MVARPFDIIAEGDRTPAHAIIVVVDALKHAYLREQRLPNFERLIADGVAFTDAIASNVRAETAPGFASIATGGYIKDHGVTGSSDWWDRNSRSLRYLYDEATGRLDLEMPTIADIIKAVEPSAKVAAISSKDRHALLLAGNAADIVAYSYREHVDRRGHFTGAGITPDHYRWTERMGRNLPPYLRDTILPRRLNWEGPGFGHPDVDAAETPLIDEFIMDGALAILEHERPKLMMIGLVGPNIVAHNLSTECPQMRHAIAIIDRQLGRLAGQLKNMGWLEDTLLIVTADHGMAEKPNTIDIAQELVRRGRADLVANIAHLYKGAVGGIYLMDNSRSAIDEILAELTRIEHVRGAWHKFDTAAPWFVRRAAHERTADVLVVPEFRYQILPPGATEPVHKTLHGAPYFDDLSIVMIFSGRGIKRLGPIGRRDIEPDEFMSDERIRGLPEQTQILPILKQVFQL
jgi:hypothetical protein